MTELTHAQAVHLLQDALDKKSVASSAKKNYEAIRRVLREFLEAHRPEELYDGEAKIRAALQPRRGSPEMDCISLANDKPSLALWAMSVGLLRLDGKQWEAMQNKAGEMLDLANYVSPGAGSETLVVEEVS